jgi:hypothetical protein
VDELSIEPVGISATLADQRKPIPHCRSQFEAAATRGWAELLRVPRCGSTGTGGPNAPTLLCVVRCDS